MPDDATEGVGEHSSRLQPSIMIRLNSQELSSSPSVRDLGVIIDSGLTLTTHVSILARTCFYLLRRIRQAKKNLDKDSVKTLVHALVLSRLDYYNSVLANLPEVTLAPLIRVQHSAARLIRNLWRQDFVSLVMMELHWLPLHHRITFKLCTLMHGIHHGHCPKYSLRSALNTVYDLPRLRTTTSVALNSNLVSAHSLLPPQKHGTPYRILLNKLMIMLNLGKT